MTEPTSDTADAAGGEGWAKTVVDGIADGESEQTESPAGPDGAAGSASVDDEVIEAELIDEAEMPADADPGADGNSDRAAEADASAIDAEAAAGASAGTDANGDPISVEDLVADLERVSVERDQYLDASRRLQAEFENYKKQVAKRESEARERANDSLIGELLPVLDAFDGAVANGAEDVAPMRGTFLDALGKQGLERIEPVDDAFDPNLHEAVMHEPGDETDGPVVAEVMRAGYVWKGRVLRPAMVKTRG